MSGDEAVPAFELPNVGVGPDPLSLADLIENVQFAVLLFLRDYHCPHCKAQVQALGEAATAFNDHDAVVVPILPEPQERAAAWRDGFEMSFPFPLLADGEKSVAEKYDQPTRYGALGGLHDLLGRLPKAVILDTRGDDAEVVYTHRGDAVDDRPDVATLLEQVEQLQETFVFDCTLVDC